MMFFYVINRKSEYEERMGLKERIVIVMVNTRWIDQRFRAKVLRFLTFGGG